ncbi:MAG: hypothetical protein GYA60_06170 [Candidatus Methanofastidiosa archaeon]|nr:hypothetical protein [Candidatus Methanofastidiosa archaeon]
MDEEINNDETSEDGQKFPLPMGTIVRLMREHLDNDKMISRKVKEEMNLFLGKMIEDISTKLNDNPYVTVDEVMFREAIKPYENMKSIELEKKRIIKTLEKIKADCDVLIEEVNRTLKL